MAYNADTMSFDLPDTDTVYISGLPAGINERDVEEYFGSIGVIKTDKKTRPPSKKIWLYRDKATGGLKGDGTVTYEDPFSAASAVQWFHDKEWKGSMLSVTLAEKKTGGGGGYGGRGGGRGGYGGGGGGYGGGGGGGGYGGGGGGGGGGQFGDSYNSAPPPGYGGGGGGGAPPGDWPCPSCGNTNFARRTSCNRCQTPRPAEGGGGPPAGGGGGGGGGLIPAPGGKPGDWLCPRCSNHNFAFRDSCQKCHMSKAEAAGGGGGAAPALPGPGGPAGGAGGFPDAPGAAGGGGGEPAGGGGGGGRGARVQPPQQGPPGMFVPDDWACTSCGNMNWARRPKCNMCGNSKPGTTDTRREGQGGGFKELDEAELEESRRRREKYRQGAGDDDEFDDWGRPKRSKSAGDEDRRAREQAALSRLYGGSNLAPSELEKQPGAGGGRERERSPVDRDRGDRERDRGGDRGRGERDGRGDRDGRGSDYRSDRERDRGGRDRDGRGGGGGGRDYDRDYDRGRGGSRY